MEPFIITPEELTCLEKSKTSLREVLWNQRLILVRDMRNKRLMLYKNAGFSLEAIMANHKVKFYLNRGFKLTNRVELDAESE